MRRFQILILNGAGWLGLFLALPLLAAPPVISQQPTDKSIVAGNNVSFSHKKTKRVFRPNIQQTTVMVRGRAQRVKACTRCMRTMAKSPRGI